MSEEQRESVLEYVRRVGEAQHGRINPQNLKIPDAPKLASWLALLLSYPHSYWLPTKPTNGIQAFFQIGSLTYITAFLLVPTKPTDGLQACLLIGSLTFRSVFLLAPHKANWWDPGLPPDWLSYFHSRILIGSPQSQLMWSMLASSLALLLSYLYSYWLPLKANWWAPGLPPNWLS